MPIALMVTDRDTTSLYSGLKRLLPDIEIKCWPDIQIDPDVEFAVAWRHPVSMWQQFPNLKVVSSLGAGADTLINDNKKPKHIQITRVVDNGLSQQMAEYVLTCILMHKRRMLLFHAAQQNKNWQTQQRLTNQYVTILGAGEIGLKVAQYLHRNGFIVSCWSQSRKAESFLEKSYVGTQELLASVDKAAYVVSLLPATENTNDIINKTVFSHMPTDSYFINVGRGNAVNEEHLIDALNDRVISGATLDVFKQEPLPKSSVLWKTPFLTITPHIAAITDENEVIKQIADNFQRFRMKKPLKHLVNAKKGY